MRLFFVYCICVLCAFTILVAQDVPRVISYQGVLVGADGKPKTQNSVQFEFTFYSGLTSSTIVISKQIKTLDVIGGLFNTMLEIPISADLNQELWLEIEANGTRYPNRIRMAAALYALNIPDNVVTSQKIKDGEIKSEDMSDMGGANENQVLTRKGGQWRGEDVPTELPVTATEGQVLVFKAGRWQAENPVVPSGVPIGTIVAFGGQAVPDGWLLCNGYEINVAASPEYKPLFDVIGTAWGGNSSLQTFRIPDLRGRFLRGVDGTANEDPNKGNSDRIAMYPGGNTGNNVGSYQPDAFQGHWHKIGEVPNFGWNTGLSPMGSALAGVGASRADSRDYVNGKSGYNFARADDITTDVFEMNNPNAIGPSGVPRTSSETRKKNVYVNYIIKAK